MHELTDEDQAAIAGGVAPAVAVIVTAGALYGAAKTAYTFGKALGALLVETTPKEPATTET